MNKVIKHFWLAGEKVMFEIHKRRYGFTHGACIPFLKKQGKNTKFRETEGSK